MSEGGKPMLSIKNLTANVDDKAILKVENVDEMDDIVWMDLCNGPRHRFDVEVTAQPKW